MAKKLNLEEVIDIPSFRKLIQKDATIGVFAHDWYDPKRGFIDVDLGFHKIVDVNLNATFSIKIDGQLKWFPVPGFENTEKHEFSVTYFHINQVNKQRKKKFTYCIQKP